MKKILLSILVLSVIGFAFIPVSKGVDEESLTKTYGYTKLSEDHILKKVTPEELDKLLSSKKEFVIYIGRPTCPYCQEAIPIINDELKMSGMKEIIYLDSGGVKNLKSDTFKGDRKLEAVPYLGYVVSGEVLFDDTDTEYKNIKDVKKKVNLFIERIKN